MEVVQYITFEKENDDTTYSMLQSELNNAEVKISIILNLYNFI